MLDLAIVRPAGSALGGDQPRIGEDLVLAGEVGRVGVDNGVVTRPCPSLVEPSGPDQHPRSGRVQRADVGQEAWTVAPLGFGQVGQRRLELPDRDLQAGPHHEPAKPVLGQARALTELSRLVQLLRGGLQAVCLAEHVRQPDVQVAEHRRAAGPDAGGTRQRGPVQPLGCGRLAVGHRHRPDHDARPARVGVVAGSRQVVHHLAERLDGRPQLPPCPMGQANETGRRPPDEMVRRPGRRQRRLRVALRGHDVTGRLGE